MKSIEAILTEYDSMFQKKSLEEIEAYLVEQMNAAKAEKEIGILFTLLNEIIGFCRDTTQKEKSLAYCDELVQLLEDMGLEGMVEYATALVNITNAYRAFGLWEESLSLYREIESIYKEKLHEKDFRFASLYNNWSLLYQEMEEYALAKEMLLRALSVVDAYENEPIKQAVTRTNLAVTLIQMQDDASVKEAETYLKEALAVFESGNQGDFHYGAALVAMGDLCSYKKDYAAAAEYYKQGLTEIEKHVGKTDNYVRVEQKLNYVLQMAKEDGVDSVSFSQWISNIDKSRQFYEKFGKPMVEREFPDYADRIAVGLVGEGSDCFGYDDDISTDHDYGVGFCMWLTEKDYVEIGEKLQTEYERLFDDLNSQRLQSRRGVFSINGFYGELLQVSYDFENETEVPLYTIPEYLLAAATNGEVFVDFPGIFSKVRAQLLSYYPERIWRQKLAGTLHDYAQYAQSNYARMMARGDEATAFICVGKAMEAAMDLVYLLQHQYAPYYKWKKRGLKDLALGKKLIPFLDKLADCMSQKEKWVDFSYNAYQINTKDERILLFEEIAELILQELKVQNPVTGDDRFLEVYVNQILKGGKMDFVEKIVELEWKQFDKVKNEGGRADCQDNWNTFSIMRKSQYLAWPQDLLQSFCNDLEVAGNKGWNLIMEKYARMMESTAPDRYEELKKDLPELSEDRIAIQEEIIKIQVGWMETFAEKYPKMAVNARTIHTSEDTPYNTSYETYLRGELGTYSERTFLLYGRFIAGLCKEGKNLAYEIMNNTAKLYGYESVEDAEEKL